MEPHFPMVKSNRATRLLGSPGWFVHQLQISLVGLKPRTDRGMEKPGMGWVAHLLGSNFVETMFNGKKKLHRFGFKSMSCFVLLFFSSKVDKGKIYHMFQYGINRDLRVQVLLLQWLLSLTGSNWYNPNRVRAHSPTKKSAPDSRISGWRTILINQPKLVRSAKTHGSLLKGVHRRDGCCLSRPVYGAWDASYLSSQKTCPF